MNRRNAINLLGTTGALSLVNPKPILDSFSESQSALAQLSKFDPEDNSEDFWHQVRQSYSVSANIINLNNGGVAPAPKIVQDAVDHYNKLTTCGASWIKVENHFVKKWQT